MLLSWQSTHKGSTSCLNARLDACPAPLPVSLPICRCPFLRMLDLSNPLPAQGHAFGSQEAVGIFGALVNSLCPVEELDFRGHW